MKIIDVVHLKNAEDIAEVGGIMYACIIFVFVDR